MELYDFERAEILYKVFEQEITNYCHQGSKVVIDDETLLSKFDFIAQQIDNFDSTVVDAVDELLEFELTTEIFDALEKIRDALSQYDFDSGEKQLSKIKASYFKELKE